MAPTTPNLVVLAGPNGAGKSTAAPMLLRGTLGVTEFVNADVIAQGLSAFAPDRVALSAGRIMLRRLQELARQGVSFAFETTLASRSFAPWIRELAQTGYQFHLVFLWLPSADFAVQRVADRVRLVATAFRKPRFAVATISGCVISSGSISHLPRPGACLTIPEPQG